MSIRTRVGKFVVAAVAALAIGASAFAGTVKLANDVTPTTSGGPFTATVVAGPIGIYTAGQTFQTFCLEQGETFGPGTTYWAVVSDRAVFGTNGNTGGADGYDLLNAETAYLYTNFMKGTMKSVVSTWAGTTEDLTALQDAIWKIEGETKLSTTPTIIALRDKLITAANNAVGGSWGNTIGNVRVMQLWTSQDTVGTQGGKVQDQLVLVPTPSAAIAGMGLLASLAVVGYIKRRRANDRI